MENVELSSNQLAILTWHLEHNYIDYKSYILPQDQVFEQALC